MPFPIALDGVSPLIHGLKLETFSPSLLWRHCIVEKQGIVSKVVLSVTVTLEYRQLYNFMIDLETVKQTFYISF